MISTVEHSRHGTVREIAVAHQMIPAVEHSRHGSVREIAVASYLKCQMPQWRRKNAAARWRLRFW
jgi:hypothetical protein